MLKVPAGYSLDRKVPLILYSLCSWNAMVIVISYKYVLDSMIRSLSFRTAGLGWLIGLGGGGGGGAVKIVFFP